MRFSRKILFSAITLISAAAAVPAGAVTFITTFGSPDPGPAPGQTILVDFNGPLTGGYSLSGDYGLATGSSAAAAAPAGDMTQYLYTTPSIGSGVATLSTLDLSSVSFYWGSVDNYNAVDVLGAGGVVLKTISGADFSPADGNQDLPHDNQRIFINAVGNEVITGLRFHATGIAFEVDDVAGTLASNGNPSLVPEPASWALMVVGFGMVGVGIRRRRNKISRVTA